MEKEFEKIINIDELLHEPSRDVYPLLAMIVAVLKEFDIDLHFQSDSKSIEVIASREVDGVPDEAIAYLEKTNSNYFGD